MRSLPGTSRGRARTARSWCASTSSRQTIARGVSMSATTFVLSVRSLYAKAIAGARFEWSASSALHQAFEVRGGGHRRKLRQIVADLEPRTLRFSIHVRERSHGRVEVERGDHEARHS